MQTIKVMQELYPIQEQSHLTILEAQQKAQHQQSLVMAGSLNKLAVDYLALL